MSEANPSALAPTKKLGRGAWRLDTKLHQLQGGSDRADPPRSD